MEFFTILFASTLFVVSVVYVGFATLGSLVLMFDSLEERKVHRTLLGLFTLITFVNLIATIQKYPL